MERISKYISYNDSIKSNTAIRLGIPNIPNSLQLVNMKLVAINIYDPTIDHFKVPIHLSSFFRSAQVNTAIRGSSTSQHLCNNGAAIDLDADVYGKITNVDIFNYIKDNLNFDQLILENIAANKAEWVHVSYVSKERNRNQILLMYRNNGRTKYENYSKERLTQLLLRKK